MSFLDKERSRIDKEKTRYGSMLRNRSEVFNGDQGANGQQGHSQANGIQRLSSFIPNDDALGLIRKPSES